MPKQGLTEIVCVLDRSGSMSSIIGDAIGGFNTFLKQQKESDAGIANMTIAMFDDEYELICESKNINDVEEFNEKTYVPRGCTALNDAIGKTIRSLGEKFDKRSEDEKPENVVFVILTDGAENSSVEYKLDDIKSLIKEQSENWNWEFIFLSSDISAFDQGMSLGIDRSIKLARTGKAMNKAYTQLCSSVQSYRSSGTIGHIDKNIE